MRRTARASESAALVAEAETSGTRDTAETIDATSEAPEHEAPMMALTPRPPNASRVSWSAPRSP